MERAERGRRGVLGDRHPSSGKSHFDKRARSEDADDESGTRGTPEGYRYVPRVSAKPALSYRIELYALAFEPSGAAR